MSTPQEKVEELVRTTVAAIEELEAEALARVREVEADAREKIARAEAAREELATVEEEIEDLNEELERLPAEVVRADLEGDRGLEGDLRARYGAARTELGAAQARRDELWKELGGLLPKGSREAHPLDAKILWTGRVAEAAAEERRPLAELRDRLTKAADSAADAVAHEHEKNRAQVTGWSNSIEWERSPVGRGAVRA